MHGCSISRGDDAVTAGFFNMFRGISPRTTTHARHLQQWIMISTLFVRPTAQQGSDLHLESSQSFGHHHKGCSWNTQPSALRLQESLVVRL